MANVVEIVLKATGNAQVKSAFSAVKAQAVNLANALATATRFAAGVAAVVAPAVAYGVKQAIDYADQISKASQRSGMAAEDFSALAYAAKLSDVEIEQLQVAIKSLGAWMEKTGQQGRSFSDVISETADLFAKMEDGPKKVAIAVERFGKAGQSMIPLLNQGSEGLKKATEEARQFGVVISGKTAAAAEVFNDNLTRLATALKGAFVDGAERSLPLLNEITTKLVEFLKTSGLIAASVENTAKAINFLADSLKGVMPYLVSWMGLVPTFVENMVKGNGVVLSAGLAWKKATEAVAEYYDKVQEGQSNSEPPIKKEQKPSEEPIDRGKMVVRSTGSFWSEATLQIEGYAAELRGVVETYDEFGNKILRARTAMESLGQAVGRAFVSNVDRGVQTISAGLTDAIMLTKSLGQALLDIGTSILSQLIQTVIQVALQMALAWLLPAIFAATATYGSAATAAAPAIAGAVSAGTSLVTAQGGGYTGDRPVDEVAGIVHGREYVFSAPAVERIGLPALEALHQGRSSSGDSSPMRVVIVDNRRDADELRRDPRFRSMVVDLMESSA